MKLLAVFLAGALSGFLTAFGFINWSLSRPSRDDGFRDRLAVEVV